MSFTVGAAARTRWSVNRGPGNHPRPYFAGFEQADSGRVIIDDIDATDLSREARRQLRQKIQFVYQNPFASLDPRQTLCEIIEEPPEKLRPHQQSRAKRPG